MDNRYTPSPSHILTNNVLADLEASRETVAKVLDNADSLEDIRDICRDTDNLDEVSINEMMGNLGKILYPRINTHPDLESFFWIKASPFPIPGEDTSLYAYIQLKGLIDMALEEIFPLVCMYLNTWFSKKKLKSLVYIALRHGSKNTISSMFYGNEESILSQSSQVNYNTLLANMLPEKKEPLDVNRVWNEPHDYISQTLCPFLYNEKCSDFIDLVWELFETEIIPILKNKFRDSTRIKELFYSWNLSN